MEYKGHNYGIKVNGSSVAIEAVDLFGDLSKYDYTVSEFMTGSYTKYNNYNVTIASLGKNQWLEVSGWKLKGISFEGCFWGQDGSLQLEDPFGNSCIVRAKSSISHYSSQPHVAIKMCIEKFIEFAQHTFSADYYDVLQQNERVNDQSCFDIHGFLAKMKLTESFLKKVLEVQEQIKKIDPEQKDFYIQKLADACSQKVKKDYGVDLVVFK